jgi:hypothetical protein
MRQYSQRALAVASAIIWLGAVAAIAAPPGAGDPTVTNAPPANAAGPTQSKPAIGGMAVHIEQRIADLHGKLQITAAQQPRWDRFTEIMRDNAREMDKVFQARAQSMMSMTAEENMKSYADIASRHAQNVQRLVPAFDALYATMSDSQKKTADQVFREEANQRAHGMNG